MPNFLSLEHMICQKDRFPPSSLYSVRPRSSYQHPDSISADIAVCLLTFRSVSAVKSTASNRSRREFHIRPLSSPSTCILHPNNIFSRMENDARKVILIVAKFIFWANNSSLPLLNNENPLIFIVFI